MSEPSEPMCSCQRDFTCGVCCANAKPWHYTTSTGAVFTPPPVDLR